MTHSENSETALTLESPIGTIDLQKERHSPGYYEEVARLRTELAEAKNQRLPKTRWEKILNVLVLVFGGLAVIGVVGLSFVYVTTEERAACQAKLNSIFQQQTSVRVGLALPENLARDDIFNATAAYIREPSPATALGVLEAIEYYNEVRIATDKKRENAPVDAPSDTCA